MFFNTFKRANYFAREVFAANNWGDYNANKRENLKYDVGTNIYNSILLLCESTDGVNFTYLGECKNPDRSAAVCYNPDVKIVGEKALITYNSGTFRSDGIGELVEQEGGWWATSVSYVNLDNPLTVNQINEESPHTLSEKAVAFMPSLFENARETVTPQWITDSTGAVTAIGYGQWKKPSASDSYIAVANLQNYALIRQENKTVADFNLSSSPDEAVVVSYAHSDLKTDVWLAYSYNNLNINRKDKIDNAVIEIYNIYGDLIFKSKPITLMQG